jgi:hypothetical protein
MATFTPYLPVAWLVLILFYVLPSYRQHRGVLITVLVGMLFLPQVGSGDAVANDAGVIRIGMVLFSKDRTIVYALLLGILIYDLPLLLASRPGLVDLPMVIWCLCPMASALSNEPPPDGGLVFRDCVSHALSQFYTWGIPYLAGRLYFSKPNDFRDLALGMVLAGLVYAPLCLVEAKMSPILHRVVFGYTQVEFGQSLRMGGYRPIVFFQHGLALSFWMVSVLLVAVWLTWCWKRDGARRFMAYSLLLLVPTVVLLKSAGALFLGVMGFGILCLVKVLPSRVWLILLILGPTLYVAGTVSGVWTGRGLVEFIRDHVAEDRASSLEFRLDNEELLIAKALKQPLFGWGSYGRNRVTNDLDEDVAVTDSLWIILLGTNGFVGLTAFGAVILLPLVCLVWRFPPKSLSQEAVAPLVAFAVILGLWAIDCLLNAMVTPLYALGGSTDGDGPEAIRGGQAIPVDRHAGPVARVKPWPASQASQVA